MDHISASISFCKIIHFVSLLSSVHCMSVNNVKLCNLKTLCNFTNTVESFKFYDGKYLCIFNFSQIHGDMDSLA